MRRRLLLTYLTLTTFVLLILEIPLGVTFANHERRTLSAGVERDAFVMASSAEDVLEGLAGRDLRAMTRAYQERTGARVVIVDVHGLAVADSAPQTPTERDFSTRPEIKQALAGQVATGVRHSSTLKTDLLYVAVPAASGGVIHGAVRITFPMHAVEARITRNWLSLGLIAIVVLVASLIVGMRLSSSVVGPLQALEGATRTLAHGELSARAPSQGGPPEVRSVARAFNEMAGRLEELVGAQSQFVADASHQLRTPLTALKLRLENIEESASGSVRHDAEAAGRELWRLQHIVDGLLTLARADGARPRRRVEHVHTVLESRCDAWRPLAAERNLSLQVEAPTGITILEIPGGLEQILDNLIANAVEASPAGAPIVLRSRRTGDWVEVSVTDQGPGMTLYEREHAFDRFWRGSANSGSGSGLGLAIVRQLARASGGDVTLEASATGGIDAIVRLPAAGRSETP